MTETSDSEIVSTRQQRIAELAKQMPADGVHFPEPATSTSTWLREAYRRTRKDGAVGVDGQTAADYEENLEDNLQSLLERAKSGTYRAPPVRRVHIPKGHGRRNPADRNSDAGGQGASAGGRHGAGADLRAGLSMTARTGSGRGRSAHQALESLWKQTMQSGGGLDFGGGYPKVFRHAGSWPSASVSPATGSRRGAAATDRQVAQRGRAGRRALVVPGRRQPAGRGDFTRSWRTCTCTTCWTSGSPGRCNLA